MKLKDLKTIVGSNGSTFFYNLIIVEKDKPREDEYCHEFRGWTGHLLFINERFEKYQDCEVFFIGNVDGECTSISIFI